ncbi:MAG TPA: hypothetical protein VG015_08890, partial [Candidatus Dormibacteraeota bacterium]|nr:hypothetical protein [Candidatus Dormibacteraeota bacterium]
CVARSVLEAGSRFGDSRLPELFCGFERDRRFSQGPCEYLVSCSPQAWATGSVFHLLQTLAGVEVDALAGKIHIDPLATSLYSRLRVEGMRVGEGLLDFTIDNRKVGPRVKVDRKPVGMVVHTPA